MSTYRVLPPVSVAGQTITFPGNGGAPRVVSAEPGEFLDVGASDMNELTSNHWILVALVGPTAQRPTPPDPMTLVGRSYLDTDLGKLITFDGATWRDPVTAGEV